MTCLEADDPRAVRDEDDDISLIMSNLVDEFDSVC